MLTYAWEILDASSQLIASGTSRTFTFNAVEDGIYTARVVVTDDSNASSMDYLLIEVINAAPAADAGNNVSADEGSEVVLLGSYIDDGILDTHTWAWEVRKSNGVLVATSNLLNYTFIPTDEGIYTATLTVSDDDGGLSTDSVTIFVANVAPSVEAGPAQSGYEGAEFSLVGSGYDVSPDDVLSYAWVVTDPSNFVVAVSSQATLTFTAPDNGVYTATLTVNDGDGGISSDTVTITVSNVDPVVMSFAAEVVPLTGVVNLEALFC